MGYCVLGMYRAAYAPGKCRLLCLEKGSIFDGVFWERAMLLHAMATPNSPLATHQVEILHLGKKLEDLQYLTKSWIPRYDIRRHKKSKPKLLMEV